MWGTAFKFLFCNLFKQYVQHCDILSAASLWAILEKKPNGELRIWNFQGYQRNSMCNFQGLIKNEVVFPRVTKKK